MEKYCTTLEKSKELEKAGWKKETKFWWVKRHNGWAFQLEYGFPVALTKESEIFSSLLAAEILEELSDDTILEFLNSKDRTHSEQIGIFRSPDLLADCWIWAKKNGLVKEE